MESTWKRKARGQKGRGEEGSGVERRGEERKGREGREKKANRISFRSRVSLLKYNGHAINGIH